MGSSVNKNRDDKKGMKNRQIGITKKAHTFHRFYHADVLVVIRRLDGYVGGYQSRPGMIKDLMSVVGDSQLSTPNDLDTVADRYAPPLKMSSELSSISQPSSRQYSDTNASELSSTDTPSLSRGRSGSPWGTESQSSEGPCTPPVIRPDPNIPEPIIVHQSKSEDMVGDFLPVSFSPADFPLKDCYPQELFTTPSALLPSDPGEPEIMDNGEILALPKSISVAQSQAMMDLIDSLF